MDTCKFFTATALVAALSIPVITQAAIISVDWKTAGDNLVTYDSSTGTQWLDVTVTANRSYSDVSTKFGVGEEFEGWRYASYLAVSTFWNSFGGNSNNYDGWSTQNNGLSDLILPYWGDTYCSLNSCNAGDGYTVALVSNNGEFIHRQRGVALTDSFENGQAIHYASSDITATYDFMDTYYIEVNDDYPVQYIGSALIRYGAPPSPVPIPAAIWLFGSGLTDTGWIDKTP